MNNELFGIRRLQDILRKVQGNESSLSRHVARRTLQTCGGTSYPSGTTIDAVLSQMENCDLIRSVDDQIQVVDT